MQITDATYLGVVVVYQNTAIHIRHGQTVATTTGWDFMERLTAL